MGAKVTRAYVPTQAFAVPNPYSQMANNSLSNQLSAYNGAQQAANNAAFLMQAFDYPGLSRQYAPARQPVKQASRTRVIIDCGWGGGETRPRSLRYRLTHLRAEA